LKESEERYRSFVQNFKGIAFRARFDFAPVFFHGAWESITGYTDEDLRCERVKLSEIVHPDDLVMYRETGARLREVPGLSIEREYRIIRKDKDVRWVHEVITNVIDESGKPEAVDGVIHDITDRKMAEEAVAHNLLHFKALIENVSDIIAVLDQSGVIRYVSPSVTRILGYEATGLMFKSVLDLLHPEDVGRLIETLKKVVNNEKHLESTEFRIRAKNGEWIVLEATGSLSDGYDDGARIIIAARDVTERREIQDALMASERRFRNFIDRACDGIAVLQDSVFRYVNPRLAEMGRFKVKEVLGKPFIDYIWPDEVPTIMERYRRRMAGEQLPTVYETVMRRKDGTRLEVELNAGTIEYDGRPADLVVVRDVSERKDSEKAHRASEERYQAIFENTGTATILIDEDKHILLANGEFERLSGFSKQEIEGKMKWTVFPSGKDLTRMEEYHRLRRIDPKLAPKNFEFEFIDRGGERHDISATVDMIPGTKQSIAAFRDITDLKTAQSRLQEEKEERELLLDNIETMVWYATDPGTYGMVNKARAEFLGKRKEDLAGKKLAEVIPIPEECAACTASNTEVFDKKKTVHTEEWITTANGERKLVALTKNPVFDEDGNVKFAICSGIDITETRKAEDELRLANRKLGLCGSLMRHDIMNQLSVINGYAELAGDHIKDPQLERYIRNIIASAEAIEKALNLAKDYQNLGTKAPIWKNPRKILNEALVGIDLRDLTVQIDMDDMEIFADPMFDRVFHNLADNVCRHADGARLIRFYSERSGEYMKLICEDDGAGVPEEMKEKLFSNGHGLQMVRDILGITGMTISETGQQGKGARFEIQVPPGNYRFT